MSDKKSKEFYKRKWYLNKQKSTKPYENKDKRNKNNEKMLPHDPIQSNNLSLYDICINFSIPYYGWKLFFENEEYKNGSDTVQKIQAAETFIKRHQHLSSLLTLESLESGIAFTIDICELYNDETFLNLWSDFKQNMYENPTHTLNCFKLAIHQIILHTTSQENLKNSMISLNAFSAIKLKILNYQPIVCLQNLRANSYGKLISTRGCVVRVSRVKHLAQWIVFICTKCNSQKILKQLQGIYTVPKKCKVCGTSKFRPVLDSLQTKSTLFQLIRIQEYLHDEQDNKGIVPRILDVQLMDDLVNTCTPGDDITVTGIMKETNNFKGRTTTSLFSLYMEAITVINNKQKLQNKTVIDNEMTIKDYLAIKELYHTPNLFPLLVHSLCPSIYGHEMIKAGLILSLFGGSTEHSDFRDNIHVLVVGDPGLGKSQILQACTRIATKGIYVCGNSSTSSGLTITLTKESGTNNFALEPGALVLADRGSCCIDEFDKMPKQHAVLLESMEQQSVSVAKSGTVCCLPTRTSILAAANPINGRFNRSKTFIKNLNMSPPLLSRFDLVFLLLDKPNEHIDDLLCKHVMAIHTEPSNINETQRSIFETTCKLNTVTHSLREKLVSFTAERYRVIPQSIFRKYISYARQYVKPKLTKNAATILQNYYLQLRMKNEFGTLSIYNRQLEAMIRLTEARAKLELRTEVTDADALDVIEILQHTVINSNMVDKINVSVLSNKKMTGRKIKEFIQLLRKETELSKNKIISTKRLYEIAINGNILIDDFSQFISKLNEQGILLKTKNNTFKFISHC